MRVVECGGWCRGDGGGNSVGGDCVGLCQCEGDDIGGMPLGMTMKGDAVGVGKEGMTWGACRHRASTFSQTHMDTSRDKGDPSLGFAVTPAPGAPCGQCRTLAGLGALSGGHHTMYVYKLQIVSNEMHRL